ncbi:hypothetical protein A3SI_13727 [Nitritalea halalkaliphila LW7]|uniref:Uncharacterized protein n=1 Tax=Nitritalea halalkaliphila LW7 TaxID=1189621 RepID=I5C0U6_9BACT|nr:hypothetical protein [Nitritalea halalkaliphila]EIM75448.1 hypothetical protein A3SI_13727 [Nitritalea halalkaliphila LW7]
MLHEELDKLHLLVQRLQERMELLQAENVELKRLAEQQAEQLHEQQRSLVDFKNQIKITKLVKNLPIADRESSELREKLNNYIHEIDLIIAYLSE